MKFYLFSIEEQKEISKNIYSVKEERRRERVTGTEEIKDLFWKGMLTSYYYHTFDGTYGLYDYAEWLTNRARGEAPYPTPLMGNSSDRNWIEYDVCETVEGFVAVVNVIDNPIPSALFTDKTDVTNCVMKVIEVQFPSRGLR